MEVSQSQEERTQNGDRSSHLTGDTPVVGLFLSIAAQIKKWQDLIIALSFFTAYTILMLWKIIPTLTTTVLGWPGDNWYFVWLLGWFRHALFDLHRNPISVPVHNYPYGWSFAYTESSLSNTLPGIPFTLLGGPVFGYNMAVILTFVFSGLVVYLWVKSLTKNIAAGLVAGLLFAFCQYRLTHLYGHLQLLGTQWIALHFAGMHYLLRRQTFSWKFATLAGLGFGLTALSSMYYLYMTFFVTAVYIAGYLIVIERQAIFRRSFWQNMIAMALIGLPLTIIAIIPYLQLSTGGENNHVPLDTIKLLSASPLDYLRPAPTNAVWGNLSTAVFTESVWVERALYLGGVTILLVAGLLFHRKYSAELSATITHLFWGACCALILSLGVIQVVDIHLGSFTATFQIPMPGSLLYSFVPHYDGMRAIARYGIYVTLFATILAGIGYAHLAKRITRPLLARLLLVGVVLLIALDQHSNFDTSVVRARPVDYWLASQPGTGAVVQFPIETSFSPTIIYDSLIFQKPFVGMYSGAYLPQNFLAVAPTLQKFPDADSLSVLRQRKVQYILVDTTKYSNWQDVQKRIVSLGLIQLYTGKGIDVYTFGTP